MKTTFNDKFMACLALFSGIAISCVAEFYSIMGLIAIYPAALLPIIIMGIVLGIGKLSATVWLKQSWSWSPVWLKIYILPAIALLMMITSIGVFGFLSKAHSDQSLVSGDVQAKIAVYDEQIRTERENIDADRKSLKQMDEAVDQIMARSTSEGGADRAVTIRRSQQKERARLLADITASQKRIAALNQQRAPIAAEVRKVEAEVGPIKYIAGFIYGSNPDANILEKSVSWVSILIVVVLDPLAIMLLLASQYSFQRIRETQTVESLPNETATDDPTDFPEYSPSTGGETLATEQDPELKEFLDSARKTAQSIDDGTFTAPVEPPVVAPEPEPVPQYKQVGGQITDKEMVLINQALSEFVEIFNKNKTTAPETVESAPVPVKVTESSNIRRTKVFPKKSVLTPEAPYSPYIPDQAFKEIMGSAGVPPDHVDGESFHKKAVPSGYIQNEEQQESNLWSNTVSNNNPQPITPQQYIDTAKKSAE
jgi:energy-converting hydrogenase Eha subunit A